jgi:hypothetical protein
MAKLAHWAREMVGIYLDPPEERALRAAGVGPAWEDCACLEAVLDETLGALLLAPCPPGRHASHLYPLDYEVHDEAVLRTHLHVAGMARLPRFGPVAVELDISPILVTLVLPPLSDMPWPVRYVAVDGVSPEAQAARDLLIRFRLQGCVPRLPDRVARLLPNVVLNCLRAGRLELAERHVEAMFPDLPSGSLTAKVRP